MFFVLRFAVQGLIRHSGLVERADGLRLLRLQRRNGFAWARVVLSILLLLSGLRFELRVALRRQRRLTNPDATTSLRLGLRSLVWQCRWFTKGLQHYGMKAQRPCDTTLNTSTRIHSPTSQHILKTFCALGHGCGDLHPPRDSEPFVS